MVTTQVAETTMLAIAELCADDGELNTTQMRDNVDAQAVERYAEILDTLPPIRVMRTPDHGLVLVDGYHRVSAAKDLGRTEIRGEITDGTYVDAQAQGFLANISHGVPYSAGERDRGIQLLAELGWKQRDVAEKVGLTEQRVGQIVKAGRIQKRLDRSATKAGFSSPAGLTTDHLLALGQADESVQLRLAKNAAAYEWSKYDIQRAVETLNDPAVPQAQKDQVLEGRRTALKGAVDSARRRSVLAELREPSLQPEPSPASVSELEPDTAAVPAPRLMVVRDSAAENVTELDDDTESDADELLDDDELDDDELDDDESDAEPVLARQEPATSYVVDQVDGETELGYRRRNAYTAYMSVARMFESLSRTGSPADAVAGWAREPGGRAKSAMLSELETMLAYLQEMRDALDGE